jgi:hypothetical protein
MFNSYEIFYKGQEKCDLLIEETTWTGLTVLNRRDNMDRFDCILITLKTK